MDSKQPLISGLLVAGAFIFGTLFGVSTAPDVAPPPASPAEVHTFCHPGWTPDSTKTQGVVSYTCTAGDIIVILDGNGEFNIAKIGSDRFTDVEAEVPGW